MAAIHSNVEMKRAAKIPDWAYRDVLFMLIDYSIRSFEILERAMTTEEKNEVFQVFIKIGKRMGLSGLPDTFDEWVTMRQAHLMKHLNRSDYTNDLFNQYRKHLGPIRYRVLLEAQSLVVPPRVHELLCFRKVSLLTPLIALYKVSRVLKMDWLLKAVILPSKYKNEIKAMDLGLNH